MPLPIPAEELPTQAELREMFTYCALSGALRWRVRPNNYIKVGQLAGNIDPKTGYRLMMINHRTLKSHRVVWCWYHGQWPSNTVDHANGNRWDNRIFNLREADRTEQNYNLALRSDNTSGIPGVCWDARREKWYARITSRGVTTHLGSYDSFEEAKLAREEKAKEVQGEFYRGQ